MSFSAEPYSSRRDTIAFVACLILAVAARVAPIEVADEIGSTLRETVLAPLLSLQTETEAWLERRAMFGVIEGQRDSAMAMAGMVAGLEQENARLRSILGLGSRMPLRHVGAEVLHQTQPTEGVNLILSAGGSQGVRRWSPVVADGGLVGQVQRVDNNSSVAMTWTHPDFRAAATAQLDSAGTIVGIVAPRLGDGSMMMLELRGVAYEQRVPPGTMVYTSGHGEVYPHGIPIGTVLGVVDELEGWSRSYLLRPAVHPYGVSHVLILLTDADDLTGAFEPR